jgi:nondiscriminating glutamyl-tRNA synthetase
VVRTRFAPSPTGSLHVGNARVASLNWLFARRHGGSFVLRIEDTDRVRTVAGSEDLIGRDLRWLGLDWDEGPALDGLPQRGRHGPYRQTERLALYARYADQLRARGATYDCWCAAEDAVGEEGEPAAADGTSGPGHPRTGRPAERCRCAELDAATAARLAEAGKPALRFRVGEPRTMMVHDIVYGDVAFDSAHIGDFIMLRADGVPTYNFAVVVDDLTMEITHVIRGVGHLSNSPRQLLLYDALGAPPPLFAHVPMVLGPDRQKLSKRHGARAVAEYRAEGYHAGAVVNYLSLLSWSSPTGEEVLEPERLIAEVDLGRIGVADVVFDPEKLRWLSAQHIARMPLDELVAAVRPFLDPAIPIAAERLPDAIAAIRTHLSTFSEVNEQLAAFFPDENAADVPAEAAAVLDATATRLAAAAWEDGPLTAAVRAAGKDAGVRGRALYEPLRIALTGRDHGPPLAAILLVHGRERALHALRRARAGLVAAPPEVGIDDRVSNARYGADRKNPSAGSGEAT